MTDYQQFINRKEQLGSKSGFKPLWIPDFLFDFQKELEDKAIQKGRSGIFAECGLGKSPIELVWAENIVRKTNKNVLILTPLAVAHQMVREGEKFGIECTRSYKGEIKSKITVANYDRLHLFNPNDFAGVVCDESGCLKSFESERQKDVGQFALKLPYRLLCTATPAPNDFIELLTSSEVIGEMGRMDALGMFFKNSENSLHPIWFGARWIFKAHAEEHFWRWVCSWSRAIRKPSDLGFDDTKFILPALEMAQTVVENKRPFSGELFPVEAVTLREQNEEAKLTIRERCEMAAQKSLAHECSTMWCERDAEGDLLEELVPGSRQIHGRQSEEEKEEILIAFVKGELKRLVTKSSITGWGLNLQICNHFTMFPSHSYERFHQAVRRFWRFGQKRIVYGDMITTKGGLGVLKNLQRKSEQADRMFDQLVRLMNNAMGIDRKKSKADKIEKPNWL